MSAMDDAMITLRAAFNGAIAKAKAEAAGPAVSDQETADAAKVTAFAAEIAPPTPTEETAPQ